MYAEVGQDLIQYNNGASNTHMMPVPCFYDDKVEYAEITNQSTVTKEENHKIKHHSSEDNNFIYLLFLNGYIC